MGCVKEYASTTEYFYSFFACDEWSSSELSGYNDHYSQSNYYSIDSSSHSLILVDEFQQLIEYFEKINKFLLQNETNLDEFIFSIFKLIDAFVNQHFGLELFLLESNFENNSHFGVGQLLKYKKIFIDILDLICGLNNDNKFLVLFKLIQVFEYKYELRISAEIDPLYQGIMSWVTCGFLPHHYENSFFITFNLPNDCSSLDLSKVPHTFDVMNAMNIHNTGNLLQDIKSTGFLIDLSKCTKLYWLYYQQRNEILNTPILLKYCLRDIKQQVFENILQETSLKQKLIECINHLKMFYFYESEIFWSNFYEICESTEGNEFDVRMIFSKALYISFDDATVDLYSSMFTVKLPSRKPMLLSIKTNFSQPNLLKIILTDKSLSKYQTIFGHLQKFYNTRRAVMEFWKDKMFEFKKNPNCFCAREWFLLHSLVRTLNIIYMYYKFCIIDRMNHFNKEIEYVIEIDELQVLHDTTLLQVITSLFIKNTFNLNLINGLMVLALTLVNETDYDINLLLENYNTSIKILQEKVMLNRNNAFSFQELLLLI